MILIVTSPNDEHADHLEPMLRGRGAAFVRFDPADFPAGAEVSLTYAAQGQVKATLRTGAACVPLADVTSVWYRRPQPPAPHAEVEDVPARAFIREECRLFVHDLWQCLDCLWLPAPPMATVAAQHKASQLRLAGALGFELPPTLVTTSPADFLAFYRAHDGNVVSKLANIAFMRAVGRTFARYTEIVSRRDLGYASAVRYCPVIFQAYVPKRVELRVTVVGRRAFAAEIRSQGSHRTRHDWRHYDFYGTQYAPHDLPPDVEGRCVRLVERLGLTYGAIDMIVTPDGRYVFLEINPSGQYLWIEAATGLPISDAVCDLLVAGAAPDGAAPPPFPGGTPWTR
jgi:hypothetical protein